MTVNNMTMEEHIAQKVQDALEPVHLELINESHLHAGHVGDDGSGQTHFKLIVVSSAFEAHSRVQRHRTVYATISRLFSEGLHACSITALTPSEYSQK